MIQALYKHPEVQAVEFLELVAADLMVLAMLFGCQWDTAVIRALLGHPAIISGVSRLAAYLARYRRGQRANPGTVLPIA